MENEGLAASSVGSYMPLCSHSGPKVLSIAAGSNDLARLSKPGVEIGPAAEGAAVNGAVDEVMGSFIVA